MRPEAATTLCWSRSTSTTSRCIWCCQSWAWRAHRSSADQRRRHKRSSTWWSSSPMAGGYWARARTRQPRQGQLVLPAVVVLVEQRDEVVVVVGRVSEQRHRRAQLEVVGRTEDSPIERPCTWLTSWVHSCRRGPSSSCRRYARASSSEAMPYGRHRAAAQPE